MTVYKVGADICTCAQNQTPGTSSMTEHAKGTCTLGIRKNNHFESSCEHLGREPFLYGEISILPWDLRLPNLSLDDGFLFDNSFCVCKCQNGEGYALVHQQWFWLSHWKSFSSKGFPKGQKSVSHPQGAGAKITVCVIAQLPTLEQPLLCCGAGGSRAQAPAGIPHGNHVLWRACELK